ncbi:PrgI family protein [uncultured Clostridium sp.]|uniref:PrgI family protein n=1 Tax=uncultured Clostridium sp. TaxID=59620 RepID=UPI002624EA61|nr:PrgI family protein [uncultured Clostridium sp.]MCI8310142.1 hypothetical protein [Clostridia bacterium]
MDNIEITVFDEIKDYKEKIYFFNIRQWIFAILIIATVVPTYLILKSKIGEEITSYIIIAIAGILGFIGFVKIHELPAEQIMPYWFRHYMLFAKPIHYMTDEEYKIQHQKKNKQKTLPKEEAPSSKSEIKRIKMEQKQAKILEKARKKYGINPEGSKNIETIKEVKQEKIDEVEEIKETNTSSNNELSEKLSKLSKEQQEALLKLLER